MCHEFISQYLVFDLVAIYKMSTMIKFIGKSLRHIHIGFSAPVQHWKICHMMSQTASSNHFWTPRKYNLMLQGID
jgi:hypothetical protein